MKVSYEIYIRSVAHKYSRYSLYKYICAIGWRSAYGTLRYSLWIIPQLLDGGQGGVRRVVFDQRVQEHRASHRVLGCS